MTRLAGVRRSFPTFRLIVVPFRWIGRSKRRICIAILTVLAMIAAPPLWWWTQLWGLPDIGEPFDVAAFRAFAIPDDRNAFVLYRQAADRLKPWDPHRKVAGNRVDLKTCWSKAIPELRQWLEENREAMEIYRRGTERPDALDPDLLEYRRRWQSFQALYSFQILALLEASRREEQGDLAGAWVWYRAMLRAGHHVGMHGSADRRLFIQRWQGDISARVMGWAADARTTPAMLRRALDDVVACESLDRQELYMIKYESLEMERVLDDPQNPGRDPPMFFFARLWGYHEYRLTPEKLQEIWDTWRAWRRETERSRRVIRLLIANWLTHFELPPGHRPRPDLNPALNFDIYQLGPEAPAKARVLSAEALGRWLDSTHDAQMLFKLLELNRVRADEAANHRALLILLASQLYRRERGTDPPTPEDLVGPYLESLPAESPEDMRDEAIDRTSKAVK